MCADANPARLGQDGASTNFVTADDDKCAAFTVERVTLRTMGQADRDGSGALLCLRKTHKHDSGLWKCQITLVTPLLRLLVTQSTVLLWSG